MNEKTAAAIKSETLINIACLRETPAFAWYLEKCIKPHHAAAERTLHSLTITPEAREVAAHVASVLREILEWPDDQFSRNNDFVS